MIRLGGCQTVRLGVGLTWRQSAAVKNRGSQLFQTGLSPPDNTGIFVKPSCKVFSFVITRLFIFQDPNNTFKKNSACNKESYLMLLRAPSPRLIEQYVPTKWTSFKSFPNSLNYIHKEHYEGRNINATNHWPWLNFLHCRNFSRSVHTTYSLYRT